MTVTVSGPTIVRFEPQVVNAIRISVSDPQGALATAGFRTGDLIVGCDGVEYKNEEEMSAMLSAAMSKKEVKFLVLRDGARREIPMDPNRLFRNPSNLGGRFEPATR